jgi:hypothetical protein
MSVYGMRVNMLSKRFGLAHTGQFSQLFPVATGRNAQFLATVARRAVVWEVESTLGLRIKRDA